MTDHALLDKLVQCPKCQWWSNDPEHHLSCQPHAQPAIGTPEDAREALIEECAKRAQWAAENDLDRAIKHPDEREKCEQRAHRAQTIAASIRRLAATPPAPVRATAEPSTDSSCAKCGCETKGEAALVNDEVWCHPCADGVAVSSTNQGGGK
jgi:hypothetical protein